MSFSDVFIFFFIHVSYLISPNRSCHETPQQSCEEFFRLNKKFNKFGFEVPKYGFKDYKEYIKWNEKYFEKLAEIENSACFKDKIKKITRGKKRWGAKEQEKIEELRDKDLPPVYGQDIDFLLRKYDIKRKNKEYKTFRNFIIEYIFFHKKEFSNPNFFIKFHRNEKSQELELLIRVLPHTRKEDLEKIWPIIKEEQKNLKNYIGKNKEYKNFHRDLEIYNLYKNLSKKPCSKYKMDKAFSNPRADYETSKLIGKKYGITSWGTIRSIVHKIDKFKKSIGFKDPD